MIIPIKLLHPAAKLPLRATSTDAGYDLFSIEEVTLAPFQRAVIGTGVSVSIPTGFYGRIADRSGLAAKHGLHTLAGVVDCSFRGEIKVVLINLGSQEITLLAGQRIAQMIIEKCHDVEWQQVDELPSSERGAGGFGSSGQ